MIANLVAALLIGLTSSAHCVFMCGGIAAAFKAHNQQSTVPAWVLTSLFHMGRLLSYALIGFLFGFMVRSANDLVNSANGLTNIDDWPRVIAGMLLIAMGLYLANIWRGLGSVEKLMEPLWKPVSGRLKNHIPARTPWDALITGLFWGWLPCGLIYSTLAWASTSNHPAEAALLMFAMGLGSVPVLLGIGLFSQFIRSKQAVRLSGLALCLFGLWTASMPLMSIIGSSTDGPETGHHHHGSHPMNH